VSRKYYIDTPYILNQPPNCFKNITPYNLIREVVVRGKETEGRCAMSKKPNGKLSKPKHVIML